MGRNLDEKNTCFKNRNLDEELAHEKNKNKRLVEVLESIACLDIPKAELHAFWETTDPYDLAEVIVNDTILARQALIENKN